MLALRCGRVLRWRSELWQRQLKCFKSFRASHHKRRLDDHSGEQANLCLASGCLSGMRELEFVVHSGDDATSMASVTVTNIGDAPQYFAISNQYLIDSQDRKFEGEYSWRSDFGLDGLEPRAISKW